MGRLPDVAVTLAALLARRDQLEPFACFHMRGHWDPDGTAMAAAIQHVAQLAGVKAKVTSFPGGSSLRCPLQYHAA